MEAPKRLTRTASGPEAAEDDSSEAASAQLAQPDDEPVEPLVPEG
jgi:hypothetical protein